MNVPQELAELSQWVLWRAENDTKVPYTIRGTNASNNDPDTWSHFTQAQTKFEISQANGNPFSGIGFCFSTDDPFTGIDLDGCIGSDGTMAAWAQEIVDACQTYTEISPSGTGVKLFCRGKLKRERGINRRLPDMPTVCDKAPGIEIFDHGKYFTVTGQVLEGSPVGCVDCQSVIDSLVARYAGEERPPPPSTPRVPFTGSQQDVWKRYCAYIAKMPDAIEDAGGGTLTFIACKVMVGFGFEGDDLRRAFDYWNDTKCHPKWTRENQIAHKISEGIKYGNFGALRDTWQHNDDVDLSEFLNYSRVELFPSDALPAGETETVVIHAPPSAAPAAEHPEYFIPGFINDVMQYTLDTATYPNPAMAFCGALSLLSVLTARRVIGPSGLYTNIYCLALANSGTGKDHPRKINSRILQQANLDHRLIDRAASGQGLEDALFTSPELLAMVDEFDSVLVAINRPFDALSAELASKYLALYSAAQHIHTMRIKANEQRRSITHPHLSIYGTCVPSSFYSNLTPKLLSNGLIARCFVVESGPRGRGKQPKRRPIPQNIIDAAEYWRDFNPGGGDLSQFTGAEPREIEYDEAAQKLFADAINRQDDHFDECQQKGDNSGCSVWARVVEQAHKLAVLYACSEDHRNPFVGEAAAKWATDFTFRQATWLLSQVEERAGEESAFEIVANRIRQHLKNKGGRVMHSSALRASKVHKVEYQKIIETLAAMGEVRTETEGKATYLCQL